MLQAGPITPERIADVEAVIRPHIRRTPVLIADMADFGGEARPTPLKLECLQHSGSFKARGAFANLLSRRIPTAGVVAASGGNHGAAVAYAASRLKIPATIFVPEVTSPAKAALIRGYGANLIIGGHRYADALAASEKFVAEHGALAIHAFEQEETLLGQGTLGKEIEADLPEIDTLLVAVGGGGLIGGIAACVKTLYPRVKIIGVEPEDAAAMHDSLRAASRVTLDHVGLFADGVAVKRVGDETFRICRALLDEVVLVSTDAICAAIKDVFEDTRSILEPAGALAIAGAKAWAARSKVHGKTLVAVASGANTNFDRLRFVAERAEVGEQREAVLAVTIPETPGSFRKFCSLLGARNITEFNYRYDDPRMAHVFVGVQVGSRAESLKLVDSLRRHGLDTLDLTEDEMAKLHVRHMVGGHAPVANELLYRFEFPERPGALMKFLNSMSASWNITLFHYRNHGADYGRVLVGMQVPAREKGAFRAFLKNLGYANWDETKNPAYRMFLG